MSHRSKREVAPPNPQVPAAGVPWHGTAVKPNVSSPVPGQAMVPPPGYWPGPQPQNNSFVFPYGAWMGVLPTPNGHVNLDASTYSLECQPGGFQSLLKSGLTSYPATQSNPITERASSSLKGKTVIDIDDGEEVRTEKRLSWMPDEDVRLVSAWLFHSNDPINGNGKKNDSYWGDVHAHYNSTTPPNRKRKVKHLRDRFQKIKRWVGFFCGSWKKATSIYVSGQSNDQLREKALQFYLDDYKEGPFTVMHCWKIMKDEPKWLALLDELENSSKKKLDDDGAVGDNKKKAEDTNEKERPIGSSRHRSGSRRYINRNREGAHVQLMADYFDENPLYSDAIFRRRFRMRRHVFLRIVNALGVWSPYFTQRVDRTGRLGLSPLQKCTAAICMLAYGTAADMLDEYLKVAESTALECLEMFVQGVIEIFGAEYLRRPTIEDMERLLQVGESRGFPGMLGSIDCMHWRWENCPTAWKGPADMDFQRSSLKQ